MILALDEARRRCAALAAARPLRAGRVVLAGTEAFAEVILDFPAVRNAFTPEMMVDLADAVAALQHDPRAVVVLRSSTPGMFCAGGHLDDVRGVLSEPGAGYAMATAMTAILDAFQALPHIGVAVVDGAAIGGGAELLTACDQVVVTPRARIRFAQAKLGVAPGWGGTSRLIARVGRSRALRLLAWADDLSADQAVDVGLADALIAEAGQVAAHLEPVLAHPREAVRAVKEQVAAAALRLDDAEARAFASVWAGPAHRATISEKPR